MRRPLIAASLWLAALLNPAIAGAGEGARFASTPASIPVELVGDHVLILVRVNGSEPVWFLLDSGAATIVGAKCAARLKLATEGVERGNGVGGEAIEGTTAANVRLALPGVEFSEARVVVVPLDAIETGLGHPVDGILGNSVLRRSVVTVDYARKTLRVVDPVAYEYRGGGAVVPLVLEGDLVFANATVKAAGREPLSGLFEIDSGGGHAVILNAPFVREGGLLEGNTSPRVRVGGLGGSMPAREGSLEWMKIGTALVDAPAALFSEATGGLYASGEFDGNIGAAVLRRFVVTFDLPHARMMLDAAGAVSE